jgi:hypothetical protein
MADRYIDQDETKIYGDYAARKIRGSVVGILPEFDAGLEYLADEIEQATGAVFAAVTAAREADTEIRKHARGKTPAVEQARAVLRRFGSHLDTHPSGTVDRRMFFTADGTVGGVGRSVPRLLLSLGHIERTLGNGKKKHNVKDAAAWAKEIGDSAANLAPVVEHADNAKTDRSHATPAVEQARQAWLQTYVAAKCGVECVLRLTGKLDLLPNVFFDLAVPAGAKVTEPPSDEGDAPAPA